jgi:DNA-binding NtrC family response regulator
MMPHQSSNPAVLLVDDDEALLHLLSICLGRAGYRVLPSASARAALEHWGRESDQVDLLVTDLDLEDEMTGVELAHQLAEQKRRLKVIYMSGGDFESLGPEKSRASCLAKPFSPNAFTSLVKRSLGE